MSREIYIIDGSHYPLMVEKGHLGRLACSSENKSIVGAKLPFHRHTKLYVKRNNFGKFYERSYYLMKPSIHGFSVFLVFQYAVI